MPDISKFSRRKTKFLDSTISLVFYDANYSMVTADLTKVPDFKKYKDREPSEIRSRCHSRCYKPKYDLVEKRSSTPDFTKGSTRKVSPLPDHMIDNKSRISMDILNEKMIIMNSSFFVTAPKSSSYQMSLSFNK